MLNKKFLILLILSFTVVILLYLSNKFNLVRFILSKDPSQKISHSMNTQVPNFVLLVKQVGNTVVNITATVANKQISDDGMNEDVPESEHASPNTHHVYGSGFILSDDGYIVTSAHVINNALSIMVKGANKLELTAEVIGVDSKNDIALLKIDARNLPMVKIGNPNQLEVGEWVAAIGAQFGFDNSVTQGIISAKNRYLPGYTNSFIQTDVPINPGSSGGALFNLSGEVVGINSQIFSRGGGYMGISFAIPIDIVMQIVTRLKVIIPRVWLAEYGIEFANLDRSLLKNSSDGSIIVIKVTPGSIADKAGVIIGDKLIAINGQRVNKVKQINSSYIYSSPVNLELNRSGQQLFVQLILNK